MRIETYKELDVIKATKEKRITLVKSEIEQTYYIKKELTYYNEELLERLLNLHIPDIPQLIYYTIQDGKAILIEEYISMPTLATYLANHEITQKEAMHIIVALCDILGELHSLIPPIIHRDIKEDNIFYDGKRIVLFDFDIARNVVKKSQDTVIAGSIHYAATEQYGFVSSDQRSDIYALGVLFHVLLTKKYPNEIDYKGRYHQIIQKMTALDPEARYENVKKVKEAIIGKKDYTIPGFRSKKNINRIVALLGYGAIFYICYFFYTFEENERSVNLAIILMLLLFFIGIVSIVTNYLDIHDSLLFAASNKKWIRILGRVISALIYLTIVFWFCAILASI